MFTISNFKKLISTEYSKISIRISNTTTLIILLYALNLTGQEAKKVVVLDPGHGGYDQGAIGWDSLLEKDLVLTISNEVVKLNRQLYDNELDIYLTRSKDTFINLADRGKLAKALKADIFISIHCNNMNGNTSSKGMEVFVINPLPKYSQENIKKSIALAAELSRNFTQKLKIKERGVKFENFQVLRETINFCPSVLLETAFISNQNEAEYFKDPKNITAIALAIVEATNTYIKDGL